MTLKTLLAALPVAALAAIPVAPSFAAARSPSPLLQLAHEGHKHPEERNQPTGTGTVKAVDAGRHALKLAHGPVAALGWPAMTMEFSVAPGVDLSAVKPGMTVTFALRQGPGGLYQIDHLMPSGLMPDGAAPAPHHDHQHGGAR